MDITENPFYILGATPRDRKSRLIELSEDLALSHDSDAIASARSTLLNARYRLAAEVAWFPGVSPKRVASNLELLKRKTGVMDLAGFPVLCSANLIVSGLDALAPQGAQRLQKAVESLARLVDSFDAEEIMRDINEDRQVSGFPAITDLSSVEAELKNRKGYYQRAITHVLGSNLPPEQMVSVYERLIAESTCDGEDEAPHLISDLVDTYEIKSKDNLDERAVEISALIEETRATAAKGSEGIRAIPSLVHRIISLLRVWDMIAQPVQLSKKSKGLEHPESTTLAFKVRSLAIDLFNEHDCIDESMLITKELEKLFAEVPDVLDRVSEDSDALREIALNRERRAEERAKEEAEFAEAVTYETQFGTVFKERFRISPNGIEWKNRKTALESVTHVGWGGIRHSVNGIPTGTTHYIRYSTGNVGYLEVETRDSKKYGEITSRLWRGVCVRLMLEMIENWKNGAKVYFGDVEVRDDGIVLKRSKMFGADEHAFHTWYEVSKGDHDGALCFTSQKDKRFTAQLSYLSTFNVHILDFVLGRFWKDSKAGRLSATFDGD